LKPENVLCTSADSDDIKISDFGLSRVVGEQSFMQTLCGTPLYLAPEVLTNSQTDGYGRAVDMWSIGVILYVMLCGYAPFDDSQPHAILEHVKKAEFDFPEREWASVSQSAKDLICRLMHVDPAERITAPQALQHAWLLGQDAVDEPLLPPLLRAQQLQGKEETRKRERESDNNDEDDDDDDDDDDRVKRRRSSTSIDVSESLDPPSEASASLSISGEHNMIQSAVNASDDAQPSNSLPTQGAEKKETEKEKENDEESLPVCQYGEACYRRNPAHFKEFAHPWKGKN
jgi:serine/threonine protein kinase